MGEFKIMAKELLLHIGMHKTGTTSIQNTLYNNRKILNEYDIDYLPLSPNHSRIIFSLFCKRPENYHMNRQEEINTKEKAEKYNRDIRSKLVESIKNNQFSQVIISGEDISMIEYEGIGRLYETFKNLFDQITILCFIRPPKSFMTSSLLQKIKGGSTIEQLLTKPPKPDYQFRLKKIIDFFGRENIKFQIYSKDLLYRNCSVAAFLKLIDISDKIYERMQVKKITKQFRKLRQSFC